MLEYYQKSRGADDAKVKEMEQLLAQATTKSPGDLELVRQSFEKIAAEQAANQGDRKLFLLSHTEARYTDDARAKGIEGKVVLGFNIDQNGIPQDIQVKQSLYPSLDQAAIEAVRSWKFTPAMKNGQVVSKWIEVQINFNLYQDPQKKEEQETRERREKETVLKAWQMDGQDGKEIRVRLGDEAGRRAEREAQQKRDAILAGLAKISMDHAIQIANSKVPGKVTECSLVGEHWEGPGELAKPSLVLYHVVVLSDEATPLKTHVLINAMDGSIFRVNKEEKQEEEMTGLAYTSEGVTKNHPPINGGVLNGKATSLPAPPYPVIARAAHASGDVTVRVVIDGEGNIIEATAISGHPLLRAAAQAAAKEAKFTPTRLNGEPVAVTGVLVYNFMAQ
jgi:TonB family protein